MLNSVIVVDDEAPIREAVEQWLSLSGFEVQLFSRAEDCLAKLPAHFPGVILSDVRMPGMSGLELLAERQTRDAVPPVILLTGHGAVPIWRYLFWCRVIKSDCTLTADIDEATAVFNGTSCCTATLA